MSNISISMSKSEIRFRFRSQSFTFDEIKIPTKYHPKFCRNADVSIFRNFDFVVKIGLSVSVSFWLWNFDSDLDFRIGFRFWHDRTLNSDFGISISVPDFDINVKALKAFFHRKKPQFLFDGMLMEFGFRTSKSQSKFLLISIISTNNIIKFRN
jgi:hypothetical protein